MCVRRANLRRPYMGTKEINQSEPDPITGVLLDHAVVAMRFAADKGDADLLGMAHESMINIVRLRGLLHAVQQGGNVEEIANRLEITSAGLYVRLRSLGINKGINDLRKNQSPVEVISGSQKMNRHIVEVELYYIEAKQEHFFPALTQALQKVREKYCNRVAK